MDRVATVFSAVVCPTIRYHSNWYGNKISFSSSFAEVFYSRVDCWHCLWTIWCALWSRWFLLPRRSCLPGRYLLHQHHVRIWLFHVDLYILSYPSAKYRAVRVTHLLRLDEWRTKRPSADGKVLVDKNDCYVHFLPVIRGASFPW